MDLDYSALKFWWEFVITVALVGMWIHNLWTSRSRATREQFEKIKADFHGGLRSIRDDMAENKGSAESGLNRVEKHMDERFDALKESRAADEKRVAVMERSMDALPKQSDIAQLQRDIAGLGTSVAAIKGAMQGIDHLTKLMNQFLMEKGRG